jgi:AraC-like DNA-binding protein
MSGFSKFHFERLFKQFTGTSFYKYVNQKRIVKAQEMLMEPNNTVTDVAVSCGFSSISSFIRMFKIHKGCTPSEFKNMYWKVDLHTAKNAAL